MAAEAGFFGLGKPWAEPIAGISGASIASASIIGSKHWVLTIWMVALGILLLFLSFCVKNKLEKTGTAGVILCAFLLCVIAGAAATHSVNVQQSTEVTNSSTKSASQTTTDVKNSAATQKDNSPAIAGGTGNSVSYGAPAETTTTHKKARR